MTDKERITKLEEQIEYLKNWLYDIHYPLAPMGAKQQSEGFKEIKN